MEYSSSNTNGKINLTVSCYSANERGEACGKFDSCVLRKKGFAEANIPDVTRYAIAA